MLDSIKIDIYLPGFQKSVLNSENEFPQRFTDKIVSVPAGQSKEVTPSGRTDSKTVLISEQDTGELLPDITMMSAKFEVTYSRKPESKDLFLTLLIKGDTSLWKTPFSLL